MNMSDFLFEVSPSNRVFPSLNRGLDFYESLGVSVSVGQFLTVLTVPLAAQRQLLSQSVGLDHLFNLQMDLCELFGLDRRKKTKMLTDPVTFDFLISQDRAGKIIAPAFKPEPSPKKQESAVNECAEKNNIRQFPSGAVRSAGIKPDFVEAVSFTASKRFALYMLANAEKYGGGNWRKGIPIAEYEKSLMRHVNAYFGNKYEQMEFELDVDHLAAAQFNLQGIMHEEANLARNKSLPKR